MHKYEIILKNIEGISNVLKILESKLYSLFENKGVYSFDLLSKKFEIFFPKNFPIELPKITCLCDDIHCHVDKKRVVCLPQQEDVFYDFEDEKLLIIKTINSLKKLFSLDEQTIYHEMLIEYNDYLHYFENYSSIDCLLFDAQEDGKLILEKDRILIGINGGLIEQYLKNKKNTLYNYLSLTFNDVPKISYKSISTIDIVKKLTQESLKRLYKYKCNNSFQYYLLKYVLDNGISNYILVKVTNNNNNNNKLNALLDEKSNCEIMAVRNVSSNFLRFRGGSNLYFQNVLVIGSGSVGSEVLEQLAAAGFTNVTIVDNDLLKFENGYRNNSGFIYLNHLKEHPKAQIMADYLNVKYPDIKYNFLYMDIIEAINENKIDLNKYSYIISCTGNAVVDCFLNRFIYKNSYKTKIIFSWLEPYGIAEHILTIDSQNKGCFDCYLKSPYSINLSSGDEQYKIRNNVCAGSFTPYGRISTTRIAANVVEIILNDINNIKRIKNEHLVIKRNINLFLNQGFKYTKNMELTQNQLDELSEDFIYEGCKTCGTYNNQKQRRDINN